MYTPSEATASIRSALVSRFNFAKKFPRTRSYHQFEPSTDSAIRMKCISYDDDFELEFDFFEKKTCLVRPKPRISKCANIFCASMKAYIGLA